MGKLFERLVRGFTPVAAALAGAGLALVPLGAGPAGATTTITVNDAADTSTGTNCTPGSEGDYPLRAALAEAATISGAVVVSLPDPNGPSILNPGPVYQVLSSRLTMAAHDASSSVSLEGVGAAVSKIQAQCTGASCSINFGVIETTGPGTTAISGVTIEDGHENSGNSGGGIWNTGTLTVSNSTITNNYSNNLGGGIYNDGILTTQATPSRATAPAGAAAGSTRNSTRAVP